jgi:hypothetical protein
VASYPFVAAPDNWPRGGVPVLAIAIHMAEGGGTVSWLTRDDGNSSHYVVERSGRVVQMVREDRAAGSINPNLVRTDDDKPFTFLGETIRYGVTANKAALGEHWRNPNAAVIAIEVEGYAADGPNAAQREGLGVLVADIRSRHPGVAALGHRDWQSYKACPGRKIPWVDYGGHGSVQSEPDVSALKATPTGTIYAYIVRASEEAVTYGPNEGERGTLGAGFVGNALGVYGIDGLGGKRAYLLANRAFVLEEAVTATKNERDVTAEPLPATPQKYPVTVGGKAVGEVELP